MINNTIRVTFRRKNLFGLMVPVVWVIMVGKHGSNRQAWQPEQEMSTDILKRDV